MIRSIKRVLFVSILFASITNAMEIKSLHEAINIAGKQRMFTQRML